MKYKVAIHTTVFVEAASAEEAQETALDQIENGLVDTCDVEEIGEDEEKTGKIWTVSIKDREDEEMDIWTAAFSTEQQAKEFKAKAERKLKGYGVYETVDVCIDCSYLGSELYLEWLDDRYGEG